MSKEKLIEIDYSDETQSTTRDNVTNELFAHIMALITTMNLDLDTHGLDTITTDELGATFTSVLYDVALDQVREDG